MKRPFGHLRSIQLTQTSTDIADALVRLSSNQQKALIAAEERWFCHAVGLGNKLEVERLIRDAYSTFQRRNSGMRHIAVPKKQEAQGRVAEGISIALSKLQRKPVTQAHFDKWHRNLVERVREAWTFPGLSLSIGKAQKWLNIYLKYLALHPETASSSIARIQREVVRWRKVLHAPVDNYLLDALCVSSDLLPSLRPWTGIDKYDDYLRFQHMVGRMAASLACTRFDLELVVWNLCRRRA